MTRCGRREISSSTGLTGTAATCRGGGRRDPYGIWLSEVMLQQTRVEVVLPYYERFLGRFRRWRRWPRLRSTRCWPCGPASATTGGRGSSMPRHSRSRRPARGFRAHLDGLLALPGIGGYTAAAVASIAFGVVAPVLDGNVERVLTRWLALEGDPKGSASRAGCWQPLRSFSIRHGRATATRRSWS